MNNWRIINKIAMVFGIIFIVFTVLAAVINYELDKVLYESAAPASLFTYSFLTAMLPFLARRRSFIRSGMSLAHRQQNQQTKKNQKHKKRKHKKQKHNPNQKTSSKRHQPKPFLLILPFFRKRDF